MRIAKFTVCVCPIQMGVELDDTDILKPRKGAQHRDGDRVVAPYHHRQRPGGKYFLYSGGAVFKCLLVAAGGNIHIAAGDAGRHVFFPEAHEANYTNRYAALLYDCSSEMPAVFNEAIREAKGPGAVPPFRGMSYNASAAQLVTMLNIGSISVKTE